MKIWMLGSGSAGNAVLVECDGTRILVDAGFGTRTLAGRMKMVGVDPASIEACVVTHEHSDHVKGVGAAAKKWGWAVYATAGTASGSDFSGAPFVRTFAPGATLDLTRMSIATTATPHDAADSVGFVITGRSSGARAGVFYDIGHVSEAIAAACVDLDILVLESNHDDHMLRNGPYPRWLQARISCDTGHLSNACAGDFARAALTRQANHLVLAHLSEKNNSRELALSSMRSAIARSKFRGTLTAAAQDTVVGPFEPRSDRAEAPMQYGLFG